MLVRWGCAVLVNMALGSAAFGSVLQVGAVLCSDALVSSVTVTGSDVLGKCCPG